MFTWPLTSAAEHNAIVCPIEGTWSYGHLNDRVNSIAYALEQNGVTAGDRVIICASRSANFIAAILAIISKGAIYVPIYEKSPPERTAAIIDDCQPRLALVDEQGLKVIDNKLACINLNESQQTGTQVNLPAADESLCYLLYTSGSTGQPKGVMVSRSSAQFYADWAVEHFSINHSSTVLSTAPFYFDMSVFDIFATLTAGGTLVIASEKHCMFPKLLVELINEHRVTHWKGVPSLLQYMIQVGVVENGGMPSLRTIMFGGEKFTNKYLAQWMQYLPDRKFHNAFGPTEATGVSISHQITVPPTDEELPPIGIPRTGTIVSVLREDHSLCATLEVGELAISGKGLAQGYWNNPERTNTAFITVNGNRTYLTGDLGYIDEQGLFYYNGRKDHQVKIQGYRIELGEVSSAALAIDGIADAVALTITAKNGALELALAWVSQSTMDVKQLRAELDKRLPRYMMPKHALKLDAIPRTDRGKTDTAALAKLFEKS